MLLYCDSLISFPPDYDLRLFENEKNMLWTFFFVLFWGECIYAFSWGFLFTIALPSSVSFVLWFMVVFARLHVSFFRPLVLFSFSLYCFAPCAYVIMLLFVVILFVATSSMLSHSSRRCSVCICLWLGFGCILLLLFFCFIILGNDNCQLLRAARPHLPLVVDRKNRNLINTDYKLLN